MAPELALEPQARGLLGLWDAGAERLAERSNAVLVKEVRQALRGRFFRVLFDIALALSSLGGMCVLIARMIIGTDMDEYVGPVLFGVVVACASVSTLLLVPFAAFSSMSAEAEDNALDLLLLTRQGPVAIVLGKLCAAGLQTLIVYATTLPWLCVAWTCGGVDPWLVLATLCGGFVLSLSFCAVGIAVSSLSRTRWVRLVLMIGFLFFALQFGPYALLMPMMMLFGGSTFGAVSGGSGPGVLWGVFGVQLALVPLVPIAAAFAADRLSHRDESRSTPLLRVASGLALAAALVELVAVLVFDAEAGLVVLVCACAFLALPLSWTVTEPEELPIGARSRWGHTRRPSLWTVLHTSGGGRAAALATVLLGGLATWHVLLCVLTGGGSLPPAALQGVGLAALTWTWMLGPAVLFSFSAQRLTSRVLARAAICILPLLANAGLALVGLALGRAQPGSHPFNPMALMSSVGADGLPASGWMWLGLALLVGATLAANAWRMVRGVQTAVAAPGVMHGEAPGAAPAATHGGA